MDVVMFERDGLIRADEVAAAGEDPRVLRDAAARGALVRVRRGAYCTRDRWEASSARSRHLLAARAVVGARASGVLAGATAAAVWRLPGAAAWPDAVTLLVVGASGGTRGGIRQVSLGADRASVVNVDGMPVTSCARTAVDVARRSGFADAVMTLDSALAITSGSRATPAELTAELDAARLAGERLTATLARSIAFSTVSSGSPGESQARVAMHRAGYAAPELQHEFVDAQGSMFVDFWWPSHGVAIEFDGKVKYTRQEYTGGDPAGVVWREKQREDRLRRMVRSLDRLVTADVMDPVRLTRILSNAGVPMRAR